MIGPRSHALILHLLDYARDEHVLPCWLTRPEAWAPLATRLARIMRRMLGHGLRHQDEAALAVLVGWAQAEIQQDIYAKVRPSQHERERLVRLKITLDLVPGARAALAEALLAALGR